MYLIVKGVSVLAVCLRVSLHGHPGEWGRGPESLTGVKCAPCSRRIRSGRWHWFLH